MTEMDNNTLICRACYDEAGFRLGHGSYRWFTFEVSIPEKWIDASKGELIEECWVCGMDRGQCIQVWCCTAGVGNK